MKSNLFQNPSIKAFKACEKEIQSILDEIAKHISQTIEFKIEKKNKACGCGSGNCSR